MSQTSLLPEIPVHFHVCKTSKTREGIEIRFVPGQTVDQPGKVNKTPGDIFFRLDPVSPGSLFVSLGDESKISPDSFRIAGASVSKWMRLNHSAEGYIEIDAIPGLSMPGSTNALIEGLCLGTYEFNQYKSNNGNKLPINISLLTNEVNAFEKIVHNSEIIAKSVFLSRNWAHEPANVINPVTLVDRVKVLAEHYHLQMKVLDDQQLEQMGANAIVAVGKGSKTPSRMIILEYPGEDKAQQDHPIVLVGKTLTFDSGGYSLKAVEAIKTMKYDKSGGMDVIAALVAASELKLKPRVIGIIGAAENLVSGNAYRPDDIIRTLSGKTVEIISTDAEGRLVLADCLTYAQQNYSMRALIDLATLTGGIVITLGHVRAGLFSNDAELARSLFESGEKTHELLWQLPLDEDYLPSMKGTDADLKNAGGKDGHSILAAIFLKEFIEPGTHWAHLDIAGMADTNRELPYSPIGATGFGVRLLIDYLKDL